MCSAPAFHSIYESFDFIRQHRQRPGQNRQRHRGNVRAGLAAFHRASHQLLHRGRSALLNLPTSRFSRSWRSAASASPRPGQRRQDQTGTGPHRGHAARSLEKANVQANKLIEEARAAAARVQEQETQKAIAQAEQIITKAREAAALERATHADGSASAKSVSLVVQHHRRRSPAKS